MGSHRAVFFIPSIRLSLWDPSLDLVPTFQGCHMLHEERIERTVCEHGMSTLDDPGKPRFGSRRTHVKKRDLGEDF
jgi:hypothetical protein